MDHKLKLVLVKRLLRKEGAEGFSLIELVVVVSVLAVLSAIAIPSFTCFPKKARATAALAAMKEIQKECKVKTYFDEAEVFTGSALDGYTINAGGSNNCQGSGGRVSAIPADTSTYLTFHFAYDTGQLTYAFKGKTGTDFTECLGLI